MLVAFDEHFEEVDAVMLIAVGGVVTLGLEDGVEGLVGGVVGTGLTDCLVLAVDGGGSVAPSVAQHGPVVFDGEAGHGC